MSMYFVGIDISKYKHDCCIISATDHRLFLNSPSQMTRMVLNNCSFHLIPSPILKI